MYTKNFPCCTSCHVPCRETEFLRRFPHIKRDWKGPMQMIRLYSEI